MKYHSPFILLTLICFHSSAQPLIHAHNDYQQSKPLTNALQNRAYSIEADLYLHNGQLVVAHDKKHLTVAPSLDALYLQPIIRLFKKHPGRISNNKTYAPVLMIDIKDNGKDVLVALIQLLAAYPSVFDRSVNPLALQIVISGDRGPVSNWTSYPSSIFFDGRPYEVYDSATLQRVAFISDAYYNYVSRADSTRRIEELVKKIHGLGKLLRLWSIPDDPASWLRLQQLGVDIINTDKVGECRRFF
ncbi:MAG: glycerophosphodiester phosphodiesterase [Chitinophagaceae bacterium]|nr:glycerophosphodiester phosphodiesterase [Chitinophagaceae bacterium]